LYLGLLKNKALSRVGPELTSMVAPLAAGDSSSPPPYILGSCSQASLLLHSPLRSPRRPRRINLVPETIVAASPPMAGPGDDPEPDSTKLDRILTKLSTISRRLDFHDQRIARIEKFQHGDPTKPEDDLSRAAVGPEGAAHSVGGRGPRLWRSMLVEALLPSVRWRIRPAPLAQQM
jgi:hypothetical protein